MFLSRPISKENSFCSNFSIAESQRQNSSMVVMGAIVGGGVMLLIVGVILLVHKRLEDISRSHFFHSILFFISFPTTEQDFPTLP